MAGSAHAAESDRVPAAYWLIPAAVALLRMLPVLSLGWAPPPAGKTYLGVSYLPADFLEYAALVRQVPQDGALFFYDPFTTEPHAPRFLFLLHFAIGLAARLTGASPIAALEWARVPLLFAFFATLWWFLRPILPERRDRLAAALLVAFASGLEGWLRLFLNELPVSWVQRVYEDTLPYHGWSVFASFFNPLWIAGLLLLLLVLRPLLVSSSRSWRALAGAGVGFVILFYVHPYSALGGLAIIGTVSLLRLLRRERPDWRRHLENAATLGVAGLAIGALSLWQLQDPVYRAATGGVFGSYTKSVLWYPLTLGLLGWLALVGAGRWSAARHPQRLVLFGWVAAVVALQVLPFLNGYKFIFLLPLPLCILAAPVARGLLAGRAWRAAAAGVLLFAGAALQTVEAIRSTRDLGAVPSDIMRVVETLADEPAGNALTSPGVGNVLPAYTPHRVWVGHWFLTPDYRERSAAFRGFVWNRRSGAELRRVLHEQHIRYLIVPSERADYVAGQLGEWTVERRPQGQLELFVLR